MRIVQTDKLTPASLLSNDALWIYNGLDVCVTYEIADEILPLVEADPAASRIYRFERALQAPALEMMLRGIKIDTEWRYELTKELEADEQRLQSILDLFGMAVWGAPLNANSPKQLKDLFYTHMRLPMQYKFAGGKKTVSVDRAALEQLDLHFDARPIIRVIQRLRDVKKKLGVLKTAVDEDGRMRSSFNVAGTETGRWSSSANAFRTGTNLQNITGKLRRMFIADKRMKFAYIDLEQAESRLVGLLAWIATGRDDYLRACESGDLHTLVCRMVWPDLPWTGDLAKDKKIASEPFYRWFTYRDMSKRGGHGSNYYGKPFTMAKHLKVDVALMENFQHNYFSRFPEIPEWHHNIAARLQQTCQITTPLGRRRTFFGRPTDDKTLRKGIAYDPQSSIADYQNNGILQCCQCPEIRALGLEPLAQVHDAFFFQFPEQREAELLPLVCAKLSYPMLINGRTFSIPVEPDTGWNWDKFHAQDNPDGLKTYDKEDSRKRSKEATAQSSMLQRRIR